MIDILKKLLEEHFPYVHDEQLDPEDMKISCACNPYAPGRLDAWVLHVALVLINEMSVGPLARVRLLEQMLRQGAELALTGVTK